MALAPHTHVAPPHKALHSLNLGQMWLQPWHLLFNGMRDSSVVCSLHFNTPTSLLRGNDFSGFFRPITDSDVNNFLSTLGCVWAEKKNRNMTLTITVIVVLLHSDITRVEVCTPDIIYLFLFFLFVKTLSQIIVTNHHWPTCSCSPLLSLLLITRRMRPFFSSVTRSVSMPSTSIFCRPPSRPQVSEIFSSSRRCTLWGNTSKLALSKTFSGKQGSVVS